MIRQIFCNDKQQTPLWLVGEDQLLLTGYSRCSPIPVLTCLLVIMGVTLSAAGYALAEVEQPDGYRMELYDAEVPVALDGATRVNAVDVKKLQEDVGAVVVDVIPEHRKPDFLPENQLWIPVPHRGVPGAIWLPDVGFGALSDVTERYFKHHLELATKGNLDYPLVFYCRINCWMSWNAAKRAMTYGYTSVYWFADGIEDWDFEGFDFAVLEVAAGQRQAAEAQ